MVARPARQGMVLFEVIMALFIFTLVAFSLVMALDSAFDAAKDRNEIDVAMRGLRNQMALLHPPACCPAKRICRTTAPAFFITSR